MCLLQSALTCLYDNPLVLLAAEYQVEDKQERIQDSIPFALFKHTAPECTIPHTRVPVFYDVVNLRHKIRRLGYATGIAFGALQLCLGFN